MSSDKSLATAKHGGCVQLPTSERERFDAFLRGNPFIVHMAGAAWQVWQAALSAQPAPGGQGDVRRNAAYDAIDRFLRNNMDDVAYAVHEEHLETLFAARQPVAPFCAPHCQNSGSDICLAAQRDGVICPNDSCDIDDGIRHNHLAARQPVGVSSDTLRALADRWASERDYNGSPVDDIRALIDEPTSVRHPVGEPLCFITPRDADHLRSHDVALRHVATYWERPGDDAVPVYLGQPAQAVDLAADHCGMRVDYHGLLRQVQGGLRREPGLAEMVRQLHGHLTELGKRWYAGDRKSVDEFLQLYVIEDGARRALIDGQAVGK